MSADKVITGFAMTEAVQHRFAQLSGDWNPVHLEGPIARRSSFGEPIAHGMNVVLTALELFRSHQLALGGALRKVPEKLSVQFVKPVFLGESLALVVTAQDEGRVRLVVRAGRADLVRISINFAESDEPGKEMRAPLAPEARCAPLRRVPVERVLEGGAGLKIDLPLAVDAGALNAAFPTVIEWFGERRVAGLALLSTAVGMEWPGALSLLADVKLSLAHGEQSARNVLAISVDLNKPEHRYTTMRIGAPDCEAEIGAFFRPPPVIPLTYDELRGRVAPIAFNGWTAIVVGGSRGLGAITAKLMAAGGAHVIFTYREAESEAAGVRDDIVANGGQCAMLQYDASGCGVLALPMNAAPSGKVLLFYAASPRIFRRRTDTFVRAWLDEFLAVYVDGFLNAANAVMDWTTGPVSILYPSSQALDEPIGDLVEYAAAKTVGEIVCRALAVDKRLRIEVPRLPRLLTDQTNAVVQVTTVPPADILLPLLLRLTSGR